MNEEQNNRDHGERRKVDQEIGRLWRRPKLVLGNLGFTVFRSLAMFVWIVVDLFHVSPLSGKAKIANFKENTTCH